MAAVAVAIISFNTRQYLRDCLTAVRNEHAAEIVVVDNGSSDGSAEMVRTEFPEVRLHIEAGNPGFGAAANRAFEQSVSPLVLLLNGDTRPQPGALDALASYLDKHPTVGVVGPRLIRPDGSLERSCRRFPTPLVPIHRQTWLSFVLRPFPFLRERSLATWSHDSSRRVPWVVGAAMAIRRSAFEQVGGFDETFFMYSEEVDLCYRMHNAGWETHFAPVTEVIHVGSASTDQYQPEISAELFLSSLRYFDSHFTRPAVAVAVFNTYVTVGLRFCRDSLRAHLLADSAQQRTATESVVVWKRLLQTLHRRDFLFRSNRLPSVGIPAQGETTD